jgi:hypothetical protein
VSHLRKILCELKEVLAKVPRMVLEYTMPGGFCFSPKEGFQLGLSEEGVSFYKKSGIRELSMREPSGVTQRWLALVFSVRHQDN